MQEGWFNEREEEEEEEEEEESWLAIETSGHAALKENHFLDDGAYLVVKLLVEMAKLNVAGKEGWEIVQPNYEGIRVRCTAANEQGWFLLRMLLHDPVMPLNIESEIEGGVDAIAAELSVLLSEYKSLKIK